LKKSLVQKRSAFGKTTLVNKKIIVEVITIKHYVKVALIACLSKCAIIRLIARIKVTNRIVYHIVVYVLGMIMSKFAKMNQFNVKIWIRFTFRRITIYSLSVVKEIIVTLFHCAQLSMTHLSAPLIAVFSIKWQVVLISHQKNLKRN
jgi:hypothetical protein